MQAHPEKFEGFVRSFTRLVDAADDEEQRILAEGRSLLAELVAHDDWLADSYTQPHPQYYQQYLLYADPQDRFSVVSFVWGPGQKTPVHDHTVWALIGMLRGSERSESFEFEASGEAMRSTRIDELHPGTVESLSPTTGDIHRVSNLYADRVSISVHVYGGNIGRISRHVFDPNTGTPKSFVSGYSNESDVERLTGGIDPARAAGR